MSSRSVFSFILLPVFILTMLGPVPTVQADGLRLPAPGMIVHLSRPFDPPVLKGIRVHADNPFRLDFILDQGDAGGPVIASEVTRLVKYFLASLTIPEKDLWVNLSPYEKDRIIPPAFGLTEMGMDLLAQDYLLKQITASLIYPEDVIGKKFWKRIYEESARRYGTTNIPVNTFNKVWIVPEKAVVYENARAGTAYVVESKLKVMLEQDYISMYKHYSGGVAEGGETLGQDHNINALGSQIVREVIIPELTKEVNEDQNFSQLSQIYNSLILAAWYKKKIRDNILAMVYSDKNKVDGVNVLDPREKEEIYRQYLMAFKKGVYNYIREEVDPATQQTVPRKYFSGGFNFSRAPIVFTQVLAQGAMDIKDPIEVDMSLQLPLDAAMTVREKVKSIQSFLGLMPWEKHMSKLLLVGTVIFTPVALYLNVPERTVTVVDTTLLAFLLVFELQDRQEKKFMENHNYYLKVLKSFYEKGEFSNGHSSREVLGFYRRYYQDFESSLDDDQEEETLELLAGTLSSVEIALLNQKKKLKFEQRLLWAMERREEKKAEFMKVHSAYLAILQESAADKNKPLPKGFVTKASKFYNRNDKEFSYYLSKKDQEETAELLAKKLLNAQKASIIGLGQDQPTRILTLMYWDLEYETAEATQPEKAPPVTPPDSAMTAPGGIDLNTDNLDLQVRNSGNAVTFSMDPAMFRQFQNAPGFVPVIINIHPVKSVSLFLGQVNN